MVEGADDSGAHDERRVLGRPFSRRLLLKVGTGATLILVGEQALGGPVLGRLTASSTLLGPSRLGATYFGAPSVVVRAVRREDMLAVDLRFVNLKVVSSSDGPRLVRLSAAPAFVLLELPPQAVLERAIPEAPVTTPPFLGGTRTLLSGPTRLAFLVPAAVKFIPYRLDDLLDLARLPASVVPLGQQRLPSPTETHIEAPWDLVLSPDPWATWAHAHQPVTRADRTELWRTRLVRRNADGGPDDRVGAPPVGIRAVGRAFGPGLGRPDPFAGAEMPLTASDRDGIVTATSSSSAGAAPAEARRLHLSALGSSLTIDGAWDGAFSVTGWNHRSTLGRDHYVRVDIAGYLAPFGHRATLVSITERKFTGGAAYLFKRSFIVVKRPVKDFPAPGQPNDSRQMPFRRVTIADSVSPIITKDPIPGFSVDQAFWPLVSGTDLQWSLVGHDVEGRRAPFSMPLLFVARGDVVATGVHGSRGAAIADAYGDDFSFPSRRRRPLEGRSVALAPPDLPGDTASEVEFVLFDAEPSAGSSAQALLAADQPNFYPTFLDIDVRLPAAQAVTSPATGPSAGTTSISFYDKYLQSGFSGPNPRSLFAQLRFPQSLGLPAAVAGGVAAPNLNLIGLSREFGAVSAANPAAGVEAALDELTATYDPTKYFPAEAKLLGSITLADVLTLAGVPPALLNQNIFPKDPVTGLPDPTKLPDAVKTTLRFRPELKAFPDGSSDKAFVPRNVNGLELVVTLVVKIAGPTESSATVKGDLRDFELRLPPAAATADAAIAVFFDRLGFVSENGGKPSFDVALRDVTFGGPLTFVQEIREFIKSPGSGLSIDVGPSGIAASYTLTLPPIAVGVFALANVSLSAGVELPFDDRPVRLRFAFCTRERPFLLTFSLFAGGGFFAVKVSANGLELVEAALEFGAAASLNLGVASGSVSIMAGVYFKLELTPTGTDVTLSGYVRLNGSLEVLGIISISVEFYMGLTYESATEKVIGRATLTVKVRVLFFSTSVSLSVERKFGGGGDPPFGEMVNPADWDDYCDAFAEVS